MLAAVVVASCGSGGDDAAGQPAATPASTPAATATATASATATPTHAGCHRRRAARRAARPDRPLLLTGLRHLAAGRREPPVRRGAGRPHPRRPPGRTLPAPFLDITGLVVNSGEQGLLSMAFAPDYADSGVFYVYYTDKAGDQRVVEYRRRGPNRADRGSARLVLRMADSESNHNGGLLLFGPDDLLYIGTGDGGGGGDRHGSRGNAQNLGSLLGKLLRIDPRAADGRDYTAPSENPFFGRSGARPEIYAYGLRNPWRFSFDRRTGDLTIGDVGQNAWEEIDFVRRARSAGANFGWRPFEGRARYTPGESARRHVRPVIVRSHAAGNCSITGGVVVRDPALAGLQGRYVFGDYCNDDIISARLLPGRARGVRATGLRVENLSSFGEDARGRVYAVSHAGPVYRIAPR